MIQVKASTALRRVQQVAEKIRNDEVAAVGTVSAGDVIRQGDLYLVALDALPANRKPSTARQLAPGTTQGSRHILAGKCEVFEADSGEVLALITKALRPQTVELHPELVGPVFRTLGEVTVTHPEHGDRVLPAGETFATIYQRAFADVVRRQLD